MTPEEKKVIMRLIIELEGEQGSKDIEDISLLLNVKKKQLYKENGGFLRVLFGKKKEKNIRPIGGFP